MPKEAAAGTHVKEKLQDRGHGGNKPRVWSGTRNESREYVAICIAIDLMGEKRNSPPLGGAPAPSSGQLVELLLGPPFP